MRWNKREKVQRPDYPKLVPIPGGLREAQALIERLVAPVDPDAELVDGGARGAFAKVQTELGEAAARACGERRDFPLA